MVSPGNADRRTGRVTLLALLLVSALGIAGFAAGYLSRTETAPTARDARVSDGNLTSQTTDGEYSAAATNVTHADPHQQHARSEIDQAVARTKRNRAQTQASESSQDSSEAVIAETVVTESAVGSEGETTSKELRQSEVTAEHRFPLTKEDMNEQMEAPALAVDGQHVYLAWVSETGSDQRTLFWTHSNDGGATFAEPRSLRTTGIHTSVSESRGRKVARRLRTMPHLAVQAGTVYLAWVDGGPSVDSVVMRLVQSTDQGATFSEPVAVHQSLAARPTYTGMHVGADGTVVCSWLDNRNRVQQPYASVRRPGATQFEMERMVYAGPDGRGICPCCPTQPMLSSNGDLFVAFRGNEADYRDIWIGRLPVGAQEFEAPRAIIAPTWQFEGCPHDGPTLGIGSPGTGSNEADQPLLHVAWMDARIGLERVYYSQAACDDLAFPPVSMPFPGLTVADSGAVVGLPSPPPESPTSSQTHPHLIVQGTRLQLVWDETLAPAVASGNEASSAAKNSRVDLPGGHEHGETRRESKPVALRDVQENGVGQTAAGRANPLTTAEATSATTADPVTGRVIMYAKSVDGGRSFTSPLALQPRVGAFQTRPKLAAASDGKAYVAWMELDRSGKQLVIARLLEGPTP